MDTKDKTPPIETIEQGPSAEEKVTLAEKAKKMADEKEGHVSDEDLPKVQSEQSMS